MTKARSKEPSGVGELLKQFGEEHRRLYKGTPYLAAFKRDSRILREMLQVYSLEFMQELIRSFWLAKQKAREDSDYFVGRAKPNVPGFRGALPNLISEFDFDTPEDRRAAVGPAQGELPAPLTVPVSDRFDVGTLRCAVCHAQVSEDDKMCNNCNQEFRP